MRLLCVALLCLAIGAVASPAGADGALPSLLDVAVTDVEDRQVPLRGYLGKVVVIFHEDKDTGTRNQAFKDRVGQIWEKQRTDVAILALCEVSAFDFWPARRFVKDALRKLQRDSGGGALVLVDWKGAVKRRYPLPRGETNTIVVARDGRVAFFRRGELSPGEARGALSLIERLLAPAPGAGRP